MPRMANLVGLIKGVCSKVCLDATLKFLKTWCVSNVFQSWRQLHQNHVLMKNFRLTDRG